MQKENLALGLSAIAVLISIACCFIKTEPVSYDYMGILVGVLSLLVTALIGWNIYTLMDFNKKADELSNKTNALSLVMRKQIEEHDKIMAITENTMSDIYYSLLGLKDPLTLEYKYMHHKLWSLIYTSKTEDIITCNTIVNSVLEVVAHPEKTLLTMECKRTLILLLSKVKHTEKIERFDELTERIVRFGSKG